MRLRGFFLYIEYSVSILLTIFLIGAIAHFLIIEPSEVNGRSMEDTLHDEDLLIIDKLALLFHAPDRGQIISLFDEHNDLLLVKRVIGLPGEQVIIRGGKVYIVDIYGNESLLDEPYLKQGLVTLPVAGKEAVYPVIPENEYFVLGDNRVRSTDSRNYGTVHRANIIGVARSLFNL